MAGVGGGVGRDRVAVESALDVGQGRWVRAGWVIGVEGWVTLEVEVEGLAEGGCVAVSGALADIVAGERVQTKVASLLSAALKVGEDVGVGGRSSGGSS